MTTQKTKLIDSLQLVMVNVHNWDAFTTILKNLGARHVQYGTVLTDYPLIGDALLQALEQHLGKDWTPEVEQTWTIAYQMIADTMSEGAEGVTATNLFPHSAKARQDYSEDRNSSIPSQASAQSELNSSEKQSLSGKLILLASLGIIGLGGYIGWNLMHTPTPSTPSTVQQSN